MIILVILQVCFTEREKYAIDIAAWSSPTNFTYARRWKANKGNIHVRKKLGHGEYFFNGYPTLSLILYYYLSHKLGRKINEEDKTCIRGKGKN